MKDVSRIFSIEDITSDEDIDELFSQLEQFKPPADFIGRVMDAVSKLPLPQMMQDQAVWDGEEGLIVHQEHMQPS